MLGVRGPHQGRSCHTALEPARSQLGPSSWAIFFLFVDSIWNIISRLEKLCLLEEQHNSPLFLFSLYIFKICLHAIFKYYTPFTDITEYWLYSPCCITHPWAHLTPNISYLHSPTLILPAHFNHWIVLYIYESASFLLYSLVCGIF